MKKIVYPDRRTIIITDKEFGQAYANWKVGEEYFCDRLGSVLTKKYHYIEPEFEDDNFEHRIGVTGKTEVHFVFDKKNKNLWYAPSWEYFKILESVTGKNTYEGLIPKKVVDNFDKVFSATKSIDDYLDKK